MPPPLLTPLATRASPAGGLCRAFVFAACAAATVPSPAGARTTGAQAAGVQRPDRCVITGTVASGRSQLPGVLVTAAARDAARALTTTGADGRFVLAIPGPGTYELKAELASFADAAISVTVDSSCRATVEIPMVLASRAARPAPQAVAAAAGSAARDVTRSGGAPAANQAGRGDAPAPGQRPGGSANAAGTTAGRPAGASDTSSDEAAAVAAQLSLPPGFSIDTSGDSVATSGAAGQINPMLMFGPPGEGPGGRGGMAGEMGGFPGLGGGGRPEAGAQGGLGAFGGGGMPQFGPGMGGGPGGGLGGGPGGMGGGPGGGRGGFGGPGMEGPAGAAGRLQMAGRLAQNRVRVQANYNLSGSPFNARPYALNGQPAAEPTNIQNRFGLTVGGPFKIPGLFDAGPRSNVFLSYSGSHGSNLVDTYSRVPTLAMRTGDFSATTSTILDPLTGQPFPNNQIPLSRFSTAATTLLAFIPLPNQEGAAQNYHYSSTAVSHSDDVNFRFTRSFGEAPRGRLGGPGGGRGGMGGRGGAGGGSGNVSAGVQFRHVSGDQTTAFPTTGGTNSQTAWNVPVGVMFQRWGLFNTVNVQFNRSHAETTNFFAYARDVAGEAGIAGAATDPFTWGVPALSFTSVTNLRDINPTARTDQTVTFGLSQMKMRGRHNLRWGGDFRTMRTDSRTESNPRGTFVFTGLYSGLGGSRVPGSSNDVADFLLGLSQQATLQYGPGSLKYRSRAWSMYFQDDWRVKSTLTINAGVRYEYLSPYWEANNHLVNLDVAPDFTAAVPVLAGQVGPFTGLFPTSIVEPDRNNVAPRVGIAWRPKPRLVVRAGYGISYSSPVYQGMAQRLAAQPPFAVTDTRLGTLLVPLTLTGAFAAPNPAETTNNYGVDRTYQLGHLQMWSLDVTRDLTRTINAGVGYAGTKGGSLDLLRAPNRGPTGLLIPDVQAFTWESSGARSIMHSMSLRVRKRPSKGIGGGAAYTWSKSMDNASSLGGGGGSGVVAQNDKDLEAEWGLSSFDQRHRLSADLNIELPFGPNRPWLNNGGMAAKILGGWSWSTNMVAASGTPFTARVSGNALDVARGTNGTLRADYNGQPIAIDNPTIQQYFNTAAFSVPAAGRFGNSARNLIIGPGQASASMALMKMIQVRPGRALTVRIQANNVFNTVRFASIDTVVNSPTFGQVVSVRPMRSVQFTVRMGF
jgi:trimeric autotransporter adhesin